MNFVGIAPTKSSNAQRVATKHLEALTEAGRAAASELSALDQPNLAPGAILPDMRDWVTRA